MSKRTEKAAEEKISALATEPSPQEAHEQAKARFAEALAKTQAQTGEDPLKAVQREAKEPAPEKAEEKPAPKPKTKKAEPDRTAVLEKQIAELSKKLADKEAPAPKEEKPDFRKQATAHFKDQFGDEEGDALMAVVNPLLDRLEQMEGAVRSAVERGMKQQAKSARKSLGEKFERLKASDDAWEMVRAQGDALIAKDAERFASPEEAYAHVAESLYGAPEAEEETEEEDDDDHAEEVASAEVTSPTRTRTERKLTPEQRSKAVFMHLFEGGDLGGAIKLRNQLSR